MKWRCSHVDFAWEDVCSLFSVSTYCSVWHVHYSSWLLHSRVRLCFWIHHVPHYNGPFCFLWQIYFKTWDFLTSVRPSWPHTVGCFSSMHWGGKEIWGRKGKGVQRERGSKKVKMRCVCVCVPFSQVEHTKNNCKIEKYYIFASFQSTSLLLFIYSSHFL